MNDRDLADAIVGLGVGQLVQLGADDPRWYQTPTAYAINGDFPFYTKEFVGSWLVAGALMEKLEYSIEIMPVANHFVVTILADKVVNESLPRAINEAFVAALQGEKR